MKLLLLPLLLLASCVVSRTWMRPGEVRLVVVAESERLWTGIAVSTQGRTFVNYPLWSESQPFAVGELMEDGTVEPFPNEELNSWSPGKPAADHFVCVQALWIDSRDRLWILDPGNPRFEGVVPDAPKLFVVDLKRDTVEKVYRFGSDVIKPNSYLNDVRVDLSSGTAYITDSGNGALLVLDLTSGESRRVLDDHPSAQSEDIVLTIGGKPWMLGDTKPQVHADGIALSGDGRWLYYQALTGRTLYRVATADLRDRRWSEEELGNRVQRVASSGASDGLLFGPDGYVYISALEHDEIRRVSPEGKIETLISDPRIAWPDSFALGAGRVLYFTVARIHEGGEPKAPFAIYKVLPE
ncbi:MAG: L-dopachrome tautomerase-related protein [Planctomycetota bacterium]